VLQSIKENKKKIILISIPIILIVLILLCVSLFGGSVKSTASKYIRETKKVDTVETINGVVCISKKYMGHDKNTLGCLVLYTTPSGNSKSAYFEKGIYKGDGSNGGEATKYEDKTFYNLHALTAEEKAIKFIMEENLTVLSCEKEYNNEEGVIYIKLDDFPNWIDNK